MPLQYQKYGDSKFVGLNSRDNAASLTEGIVAKSENFRFDRGVATVRKGLQRKTSDAILGQPIFATCTYMDGSGQEQFVICVGTGLYTYNPQTEIFSPKTSFPSGETIITQEGCEMVVAINKIYISRGHSKRPLIATIEVTGTTPSYLITGIIACPTSGTGSEFPNCSGLLYYSNRLVAIGQHHSLGYTPTPRSRDCVCVSNYLDFDHWDLLDVFTFNQGANDEVVAVKPWTLNEFTVFLKNSIYYVNVGTGRYILSDPLNSSAQMRVLVSDIGCSAKDSIVQANGGIIFLSDNGIYSLNPQQVGTNESLRLLTNALPLSSPIDDVIQRINKNVSGRAVAIYWGNRYYLAVPLDTSIDNNAVLVFNFITGAWESVDLYPTGFDVFSFEIGKKERQRRLYCFDTDQGVFLMEQLSIDEYGAGLGTPVLPFYIPTTLSALSYTPNQIKGVLRTRVYDFDDLSDKRFSNIEVDINCDAGASIKTYVETVNPDTRTLVDTFGSPTSEDFTRRLPVRKIGYGIQISFETDSLITSVRSVNTVATILPKQNISKK